MPHLLLIMEPPGQRATRTETQAHECWERMLRFGAELQEQGLLLASQSLASQASAARVQSRGGRTQVIDGPFAEAKEMVGGFFLIDVDSRSEALDIAARCPAAQWATVEVRALGPCFDDAMK